MIAQEDLIAKTKEEILSLLKEINRPGIDNVIRYITVSNYFRARCNSHHQFRGGLAVHSLGVYNEFKKLKTNLPEDSIRIVSLLHDICKAHHPEYDYIGKGHHGIRSVMLLKALNLKFASGEYEAIEKHLHRIQHTPSSKIYNSCEMLRHYLHQCDHRDAATFPGGFNSFVADSRKNLKYQFDTLLYSTKRPGIEIVIDHLYRHKEAFYKAPASVINHNNFEGGLVKHSMEVYREAKKMYDKLVTKDFDDDSVFLCSLLHDVCKYDEYEIKNNQPARTEKYKEYKEENPHGLKSLRLLCRWHLELTEEEREAIIWHMGKHAKDAIGKYGRSYEDVASQSMLVKLIHDADSIASKKAEKKK